MRFRKFHIVGILLLAASARAEDICNSFSTSNELLQCLNEYHPDTQVTKFGEDEARGLEKSISAFQNPELSLETAKGSVFGETRGDTQVSISQPIELWGKISSKHRLAKASGNVARIGSQIARSNAYIDNALKIVRYRQILEEISILGEAVETYEKVDRQFSSRPKLSPDQQVSFGIFKLAIGDYRHKLTTLVATKRDFENFFKIIPGFNFEKLATVLPKKIEKWPELSSISQTLEIKETAQFKLADASVLKAQAGYDLARSGTWPDITVGLSAQNSVEGTTQFQSYGFFVSLPFPLWNWNRGERYQAYADKMRAEIQFNKESQELSLKRENLVSSYVDFVKTLKAAPSIKEIDRKHRNTENLFYNGLISGALVVEAHRQILDFTLTQNELELQALQVLLSLYSFENKVGDFRYE